MMYGVNGAFLLSSITGVGGWGGVGLGVGVGLFDLKTCFTIFIVGVPIPGKQHYIGTEHWPKLHTERMH